MQGRHVSTGLVTCFGMLLGAATGPACFSSSSSNPDAGGVTPGYDSAAPSTDAGEAAAPVVDASHTAPSTDAGRSVEAGVFTEFPIPTSGSSPNGITAGPDGNLWFTEFHASKVAKITTAGVINEFTTTTAGSFPYAITAGSS